VFRNREVCVKRIAVLVLGFTLGLPVFAQQLEQYGAKKQAEKVQPNQYLLNQSGEKIDLIQEYYQRLLGKQSGVRETGEGISESLLPQMRAPLVLEGAVDPASYIVGPGDTFVMLWGDQLTPIPFTVTPEGLLVLPTVGAIDVSGQPLAEVKKTTALKIKSKYPVGEAVVALLTPRTFRVTVVGSAAIPGTYPASAIDRVDRVVAVLGAVKLAGMKVDTAAAAAFPGTQMLPPSATVRPPRPSLRHIRIFRMTGDTLDADLVRFYATGDRKFNPVLRDGDVIFVPVDRKDGYSVDVWGAVRLEGSYEFREGDSLTTALDIAQGVLPGADMQHVEIERVMGPDSLTTLVVNLAAVREGKAPDIPLRPNDRIYVRIDTHATATSQVSITGEVRYPGAYPIREGTTTLREVIARGGGFTSRASLADARVIRNRKHAEPALGNPDYRRLSDMRLSTMDRESREYYDYEATIRNEQVSVDFLRLFGQNDAGADVTLEDGDEIYVPEAYTNVYVFGQVNRPGYLSFSSGADVDSYIAHAGGLAEEADGSEIQVIKAGTKKWVDPRDTNIEPGDQVWVPKKTKHGFDYYWPIFRDLFAIVSATATSVLLYIQVTKK